MNPWRRSSLTHNPYSRTAFRVARVPREITRRKTLVQLIGQTENFVKTHPQAHTIEGTPVTRAELNAVGKILLDPKQRIVAELLEHATESLPLADVRKLFAEVTEAMRVESSVPLPLTDLRVLEGWVRSLLQQFLIDTPPVDPSFGALELELIPPFGCLETDDDG